MEEKEFRDIEMQINQIGYTLADFVFASSRFNSTLLMLKQSDQLASKDIYDTLLNDRLTKGQKGKKLEELTALLFEKSVENLFDVFKNCRTSTNEIDLLIRWTEQARLSGISSAFPCFGDAFLCECKNYDGAVGVTYVGKFCSLMTVTNTMLGIMISWDGVTGRSKWSDSKGLIKKIALHENRYIVVIDKNDLKLICENEKSIFSTIYDKYMALKNDIEYETYILQHEAESSLR